MSIEKTSAKIKASIWQAIAQSGVSMESLPAEEQARLVDAITTHMLQTFNEFLDEAQAAVQEPEAGKEALKEGDEVILWKGRPFLSMVESYIITNERIKITSGFLGRMVENYELIRIQDIDFSQKLNERMMGIGDIAIRGHDASDPQIVLRNVSKPEEVYEILRKAWLEARKRHGLQFREYM